MTRRSGLVTAKLVDEGAERVRLSHHRAIVELQDRVDNLVSTSGGWTHRAQTRIDSDTDNVPIRGVRGGNADGEYRVVLNLLLSTGVSKDIAVAPTNATTTDLDSSASQSGTSVTFANSWAFLRAVSAPNVEIEFLLNPRTGRVRSFFARGLAGTAGTSGVVVVAAGVWDNASTDVDGLVLTSTLASSILAGSTVDLFTRPLP